VDDGEVASIRRMAGDYHVIQTILWARAARRRLDEVIARTERDPDELVDRYGELLQGVLALESALIAAEHAVLDHAPNLPKPRLPTRRQRAAIKNLRHVAAHEETAIHEQDLFLIRIEGNSVVVRRGGRKHTLAFEEWRLIVDELELWARTTAQAV
jgi:hypothetical protein